MTAIVLPPPCMEKSMPSLEEPSIDTAMSHSDTGCASRTMDESRLVDNDNTSMPTLEQEEEDSVPSLCWAEEIDAHMDEILEQQEDEASDIRKFGGLDNLGNTCYMSSAVQMLASLDQFTTLLSQSEPENAEEKDLELRNSFLDLMRRLQDGETVRPELFKAAVDARSSLFAGFRQQDSHEFLTTLLDLLDEDYKKNIVAEEQEQEEESSKDAMQIDEQESPNKKARTDCNTPDDRISPLRKESTDGTSSSFADLDVGAIDDLLHGGRSTRDAPFLALADTSSGELNGKLLGGRASTHGVVLTPFTSHDDFYGQGEPVTPTVTEEPPVSHTAPADDKCSSPIDDYFTTKTRVRLTCDSCKFSRSHTETFLHLSLEIASDSASVEDGLRRFFAPEKREIKCEKCFCETATQTSEITQLPRALLLHFKRFIVDVSPDYSSISYRKNQSSVVFDSELSVEEHASILSDFMAPDCAIADPGNFDREGEVYTLRSTVNHIGSSASCGHYTADGHRRLSDGSRRWMRFNDSLVSYVSQADATSGAHSTAYMVMYELQR